ncbi:helix-turn-helix transcriptional regulator [Anaeromicrobium sediminis]|uniref:HTH deoR-type domain-containing protein n=1 Tax=Anaeromicrobium sediminis TaxID=1478221 RepID=A0A267ML48_9FIRM|nr:YafY family protein [Anaeromicrobium sediminis]PAB60147.1 hypothetical protein CCE28_07185 [Anaeromicrobium sediminis]
MQIERLLRIVDILMHKKTCTAKELADIFHVSTKTIYRDMDTLTIAQIPIITTKGKNGGISILEDYKIDKSLVTQEEQNSLIMGLQALKDLNYVDIDITLTKLKNVFNKSYDSLIEIDFAYWDSHGNLQQIFKDIKKSLLNGQKLKISYCDISNNKSERIILPLKLLFKQKEWYLSAFCELKNDYRIFNILRINNVSIINESFVKTLYKAPKTKLPFTVNKGKSEIKLLIDKKMKDRVYQEFEKESITVNEDGDYCIKYKAVLNDWFYSYILSYGTNIKILEPESLKEAIRNKVNLLMEHYN